MDRRSTSNVFLGKVILVLALCVVILGFSVMIRSKWSSEFNYSVAISSENRLGLLVINPIAQSVFVITIPENMMMPVVGMRGEVRSAGVWKFGQGEEKPLVITERTLETFLGTKTDGLIHDKEWNGEAANVGWKMFLKPAITDLPMIDRFRLAWFLVHLRTDQRKVEEVPLRLGVVEKLPDGSEVVLVDRERLMGIREGVVNEKLLESNLRLTLENGSGVSSMGILAEAMVEAAGGLVSQVREGEKFEGWCQIVVGPDDKEDVLVKWVMEKMECKRIDGEAGEQRLRVGTDFGKAYGRN